MGGREGEGGGEREGGGREKEEGGGAGTTVDTKLLCDKQRLVSLGVSLFTGLDYWTGLSFLPLKIIFMPCN